MNRFRAVLLVGLLMAPVPAQDKAAASKGATAYRALREEFDGGMARFRKAFESATTAAERKKALAELQPRADRYAPRFMDIARRHADDPSAVDALAWVVTHPVAPGSPQAALRGQALARLSADHLADRRLGALCTQLVQAVDEPAEKFLRAVLAGAPTRGVRARACASLAHNLKYHARLLRSFEDDAEALKDFERVWGKPTVARLRKRDPAALLAEAEKLFETVRDRYGTLPHPLHGTLAGLAKWHLLSIRKPITVGKVVPNVNGQDAAGKKMTLNEFDGKVILMAFWTSYFPPCREMIGHERKLVERLAGRPFVLLGVNGDGDRAAVQQYMKAERITWRSFFDGGGTGGPIATRWEVDSWPTLVLMDHEGVVRSIYEGWPDAKTLDAEIDKLVKAAEAAK